MFFNDFHEVYQKYIAVSIRAKNIKQLQFFFSKRLEDCHRFFLWASFFKVFFKGLSGH